MRLDVEIITLDAFMLLMLHVRHRFSCSFSYYELSRMAIMGIFNRFSHLHSSARFHHHCPSCLAHQLLRHWGRSAH